MNKKEMTVSCGGLTVRVFPAEGSRSVVYWLCDDERAEDILAARGECDQTLAFVAVPDWDRDLSPWSSPRAFRGGADFAGGAGAFLALLTSSVIPAVEGALGGKIDHRAIGGYSLAGLFALWSLYETPVFDAAASASGSLWFDGFLDFAAEHEFCRTPRAIYLSLGDRESHGRNPRMTRVGECTQVFFERCRALGVPAVYESNAGTHFDAVPERCAKALRYLAKTEGTI